MLISKFDLYNPEWLELVFDNRNKEYGAYDLRQHYANNMVRAMGITFFIIALLCGASIIFRAAPRDRMIPVTAQPPIVPIVPKVEPPVKRIITPPATRSLRPVLSVNSPATQRNVEMIVAPDIHASESIRNADLIGAISTTTKAGTGTGDNAMPTQGDGTATQPVVDDSVHPDFGLDVMPAPVGGDKAWAKFLSKNLRYPVPAQEEGVSGKVILSFIIEKDGSLSNIVVERQAGHGFDEEALRVLKLAKAWKPGMQNGQAVRVRYMIPINFQLADSN